MLLSFYKEAFFHPGTDVPRTVACADPSEYFVAQAVVTAGEEGVAPLSLLRRPAAGAGAPLLHRPAAGADASRCVAAVPPACLPGYFT